jgi:hypothetical protein
LLNSSGDARLPATDGSVHVAFGLRALSPVETTTVDVSVSYAAEDSFVLVIPPAIGTAQAAVTFVPHTATVGAWAFVMPGFGNTSDVAVTEQQNRPIGRTTVCDFGSEVSCLGPVTPNLPVTTILGGRSSDSARLAVYVAWA